MFETISCYKSDFPMNAFNSDSSVLMETSLLATVLFLKSYS